MEIVLCVDATVFTLAFVCYIALLAQESYCDGIMNKYEKLCKKICGGNYDDQNDNPGGGNNGFAI